MLRQVRVAVAGSINMDLAANALRFPHMDKTLLGTGFNRFMGGKGANQAVAVAYLSTDVRMVGTVGDDGFGHEMLTDPDREDVCNDCVKTVQGYSSGIANITVTGDGNSTITVSDTNLALTPEDVLAHEEATIGGDVVLSQPEIPTGCVITTAKLAQKYGRSFVLNPAPAQRLSQELFELTTLLTPNTYELAASLGLPQDMSAEEFISRSPCPVLMMVGEKGAVYSSEQDMLCYVPSFSVIPVDFTGAGDILNGAFTMYWKEGMETAVRKACAATTVPTTQNGAQDGMPFEEELEEFLAIRQQVVSISYW